MKTRHRELEGGPSDSYQRPAADPAPAPAPHSASTSTGEASTAPYIGPSPSSVATASDTSGSDYSTECRPCDCCPAFCNCPTDRVGWAHCLWWRCASQQCTATLLGVVMGLLRALMPMIIATVACFAYVCANAWILHMSGGALLLRPMILAAMGLALVQATLAISTLATSDTGLLEPIDTGSLSFELLMGHAGVGAAMFCLNAYLHLSGLVDEVIEEAREQEMERVRSGKLSGLGVGRGGDGGGGGAGGTVGAPAGDRAARVVTIGMPTPVAGASPGGSASSAAPRIP